MPVNAFEKLQKLENEQWIRLENTWVYGQVNRNDYHYAKVIQKLEKLTQFCMEKDHYNLISVQVYPSKKGKLS